MISDLDLVLEEIFCYTKSTFKKVEQNCNPPFSTFLKGGAKYVSQLINLLLNFF